MKKLVFWGACLWALAGPALAQAGPPSIVVVRIVEYSGRSILYITRSEGKTEKVEINTGLLTGPDKSMGQIGEGYQRVFQGLYQEGYTVQSTFSTTHTNPGTVTMLFVKAQP